MERNEAAYCGKSLDGFEYAFSSLLEANGVDTDPLPSLDCLSLRCFAFRFGGEVRDWFRPAAEWRSYLPELAENLGCPDALEARSCREPPPDAFQVWTLVGEAPCPGQRESVRSRFYSGAPPFFLCRRVPGRNEFWICDPAGGSLDLAGGDELYAGLGKADGFLAWFREPPAVRAAAPEAVLDRALAWRRARGAAPAERFHGGTRELVSLRYGLMNGYVQTDKAVRFFEDAGLLPAPVPARLRRMLAGFPDAWRDESLALVRRVDEALWSALEKER